MRCAFGRTRDTFEVGVCWYFDSFRNEEQFGYADAAAKNAFQIVVRDDY